jgi:hypothetical protein
MKLIHEIIELLSSDTGSLNNALLKAKVLLHKLGEKDLITWVNSELNGYNSIDDLPGYRVFKVSVMGNFSNLTYRYQDQPLPLAHLDKKLRQCLETTHLNQSVAVLESYAKDESDLQVTIAPELYPALSKGLSGGYHIENAWGKHSAGAILQAITEVRSRLLDFVLELSERIPEELAEDKMKERSKEIGTSELFRNAVFGDNATIVVGNSNTQNIRNTIAKNDFEGLAAELRKYDVREEELTSLRKAIDADEGAPEHEEQKFGKNVRNWLSAMLEKATNAVWSINLGITGNLLTEALKAYYGWFGT